MARFFDKIAALGECPTCKGPLTDMGGVYFCEACQNKGKTVSKPNEPKVIAQCRKIVNEGQYGKVTGVTVDGFTASAIVQVYDALKPESQAKFTSLPIGRMADIAFKLINGQGK